jgi:hypothetical protein
MVPGEGLGPSRTQGMPITMHAAALGTLWALTKDGL